MATLPAIADYTGSGVTQGGKKTFMTSVRAFLAAALGTDSAIISMPGTLEVATSVAVQATGQSVYPMFINDTHASFDNSLLQVRATRNTTNGSFNAISYYNSTAAAFKFLVLDSGNVQNTNNSYGAISDPDKKRDVEAAKSQWDDIKALGERVVKYRMKSDPDGPLQIGLLSRAAYGFAGVKEICPGLVFQSEDREEVVTGIGGDGRDITELKKTGTVTEGLNYSVINVKMLKALSEAQSRIEALEAKVAALGV